MFTQKFILTFILLVLYTADLKAASSYPFVASDFNIPEIYELDGYKFRMLTINDAVKDYDAVMTSTKYLQNLWGSKWPEGHTLEQNIIDLGWHQYEFQNRRSFAYSIVPKDESRILGTIYINPTRKKGYDAAIHYWVRQSEVKTGFEEKVLVALKKWLKEDWPFRNAAFPSREIDRDTWLAIPDEKR